jgi:hypothetical protein
MPNETFTMKDVMAWPGMEEYVTGRVARDGERTGIQRRIFSRLAKPLVSLLVLGAGLALLHWRGWR